MRLPRFIPTISLNTPPAVAFAKFEAAQTTMQLEFHAAFQKLVAKHEKAGIERARLTQVVVEAGKALAKYGPPQPKES